MRDVFGTLLGSNRVLSRKALLLVCLGVVVGILVLWEIVEHTFFDHVDFAVKHRWYLMRDIVGASITTLIAVRVVFRNWERAEGEIIRRDSFLANIVNNSGDSVAVLDAGGKVIFWNEGARRVLGYRREEAVGRPLTEFAVAEGDGNSAVAAFLKNLRSQEMVRGNCEVLGKGGKCHLMNMVGTQVLDAHGNRTGTSVFMQDITKERFSEEKLEQSDRVDTLQVLAASIAHEVGTPLNVISGNAEYLISGRDTMRTPGKELKIIIDETERVSKLIRRLMHITQPQSLDLKPLQINGIVQKVLDFTTHEMARNKVAVQTHLESHLPEVMGDADQLEQVLLNMIINAVQAMAHGGRLFVSTSLWQVHEGPNPLVQLRISDTGVGIPRDVLPKITNPFFSTKGKEGSRGLGLSVSYRIIEDHKGTMRIESTPGHGTSIVVRLPGIP